MLNVDAVLGSCPESGALRWELKVELSQDDSDEIICDRITAESVSASRLNFDLPACDIPPTSSISRPL